MKVVVNKTYGSFILPYELEDDPELMPLVDRYDKNPELRTHPKLVSFVENNPDKCDLPGTYLTIIDIPDDVDWEIEEYDGVEWVSEKHRRWF